MDDAGTEHESGWVLVDGSVVSEVGRARAGGGRGGRSQRRRGHARPRQHPPPPLPDAHAGAGTGRRSLHVAAELYPYWARLDADAVYAAARTGIAELALSGCTTVFDHHYVFPHGTTGLVEAEVQAARELGVRIVASRGSWIWASRRRAAAGLGRRAAGRRPGGDRRACHDAARAGAGRDGADRGRAVLTVLGDEAAHGGVGRARRRLGLQLHTHLAETVEEDAYCRELYGCTPVEYLAELGWTAGDVWCAPASTFSPADVQTFAAAGVGVAHCPTSNLRLGAGVAPVRELVEARVRVGLGVDGSASNERSDLFFEVKQALLVARGRGGPGAMTCRDAVRLGTRGGAAVLARNDIGSIEPGKCADLAVWRTDGLELGGAEDRVPASSSRPPSGRAATRRRRGRRLRRPPRQGRRGQDRPRAPRKHAVLPIRDRSSAWH